MFSTTNASGSTSQAAGICEALESGAGVFLLYEDTCATNFMIRDSLMQKLVEKNKEPITPYIDRVRTLFENFNISTIIVMGGSGDYFSIADHVICMVDYIPHVVTQKAKTIAKSAKDIRISEACSDFIPIKPRIPLKESFYPFRSPGRIKIAANTTHQIYIGWDEIFFSDIEQIVEMSQTRAIAWAIYRMIDHINERLTLLELIEIIMTDIQKNGLESLTPEIQGDLSIFRPHELAAVINRARSLKMEQKNAPPL
jgi:predicted ABC-class ATPase